MPATRLIALNSNAGAFVNITSSIPARRVEIVEDEAGTPQGLQYKMTNDNFTQQYAMSPGTEPLVLGNVVAHGGRYGAVLGYPAQKDSFGNTIAATTLIQMRSATASTTNVRVTEFE